MKVFTASTDEPIHLGKRLASSGEGTVWHTDRSGYLAKLYHSPDLKRVKKLKVMVAHPPVDPMQSRNHISFAWPHDLLKDSSGAYVGFLMPQIPQGVDLTSVYNPRLRKQKIPRFNWRYLHTTAVNIAWITQELHAKDHVIGDIKPQNMLVNDQALVSVIDTDSFQIRDPQTKEIFHCTVGSEGFTPVELLGKELASFDQTEVHDRFRLGVIIHLLLFGDHPFKGKWVGPGDSPDPTELIRKGYWPYTTGSLIRPGPYTIPLEVVHPEVQQCFLRCFNNGHLVPNLRPTAAEWCDALRLAIAELTVCSQVPNHWYRRTASQCYWCERKQKLGVDIFDIYSTAPAASRPARNPRTGTSVLNATGKLPGGAYRYHPGASWTHPVPHFPIRSSPRPKSSPFRKTLIVGGIASLLTGAAVSLFFVFEQPAYWEPSIRQARPSSRISLENVGLASSLNGHLSNVISVAISRNGQTLTSVGKDGTTKRWNLGSGELLYTSPRRSFQVSAVAFSPDRQIVASGGEDKTIRVWSLSTGKLLRSFSGHAGAVKAIAFDPKGQTLASGGEDRTIKTWSLSTGKLLRSFSGHTGHVNALAFSPNGQILASGGEDRTIKTWSLSTTGLLYTLPEDLSPVNAIAFSPNGQNLASGYYNGTIKVWNLSNRKLLHTLLGDLYQVNTIAFSPNGQTLASGGEDDTIKLWNLRTGELFRILSGHSAWISSVAFSPNGQTLVSGSQDTTIKIWRVR